MKLIKLTDDHYVVVNDSEIKENDWFYNPATKEVLYASKNMLSWNSDTSQEHKSWKKITHSTKPIEPYRPEHAWYSGEKDLVEYKFFKIKELPLSEAKTIAGEVNVSKKAAELARSRSIRFGEDFNEGVCIGLEEGYELGYNQCLEDNKEKKYTEEDFWKAVNLAYTSGGAGDTYQQCENFIKEQILQPPTEWEVEFDEYGKFKLK